MHTRDTLAASDGVRRKKRGDDDGAATAAEAESERKVQSPRSQPHQPPPLQSCPVAIAPSVRSTTTEARQLEAGDEASESEPPLDDADLARRRNYASRRMVTRRHERLEVLRKRHEKEEEREPEQEEEPEEGEVIGRQADEEWSDFTRGGHTPPLPPPLPSSIAPTPPAEVEASPTNEELTVALVESPTPPSEDDAESAAALSHICVPIAEEEYATTPEPHSQQRDVNQALSQLSPPEVTSPLLPPSPMVESASIDSERAAPSMVTLHPSSCLIPPNSIDLCVCNLLSADEARNMIQHTRRGTWSPGQVGSIAEPRLNLEHRDCSLQQLENPLTRQLAERLFERMRWRSIPIPQFEYAHVARFTVGQHWRPHYSDFLTEANPRYISIVLFLNSLPSESGGELRFPAVGCQFTPRAGSAVIWRQSEGESQRLVDSIMEECEVTAGIKYVIYMHLHCRVVRNGEISSPP